MPQDAHTNSDQIAYWNAAAGQSWVEFQDALDRQIEPLGARAIEVLAPAAGERILDIGCGCGQTTLELAKRVGPSGVVLGVDISQPMLALAQERGAGLGQAVLLDADAQTHAFETGAYDAIHSRFGVMFFQDPHAAFANLRRSLRSGGRVAFVCWRAMAENPIMTFAMAAAAPHLPAPPPPTPDAPGPFAFADADKVRSILDRAGFQDVVLERQDMPAGGNGLEDALSLALRVGPLRALLAERPQARPAVIDDIRGALRAHLRHGRVFLPSATWIVSARTG